MRLKDKVSVVTGGAEGIGRETAIRLAKEGSKVIVSDFNEELGELTVRDIQESGGEARFFKADVTSFEQVEALVEFTVQTFGNIHVMFNNAGIGITKPFLDHSPEDYHKVVNVNQHGVYYGMLAAARKMKDLGTEGVIINNASVFGFVGTLGITGYQAAKGAVVMLTKHGALELAPHGIRVVGIGPAAVNTKIVQGYRDAGLLEYMKKQQLTRKLIEPEEIAAVTAFLATDEARSLNGSIVMADDGFASFKSDIRP
ncbi:MULTISPECIES: SDR family oxidoreductase [Bacillaceae]|uniref:SDR family oxidoreductase n=1 Tax=Metabacillus sediminis TaxID=3117746 RepID=A0ABZ2NET8_9BACI|nr:SDR family oxidoreductase [Bacillus sp. SJS]KZZ83291.1 short-chain dehydrogenase [Bacillus sp. SJS]